MLIEKELKKELMKGFCLEVIIIDLLHAALDAQSNYSTIGMQLIIYNYICKVDTYFLEFICNMSGHVQ